MEPNRKGKYEAITWTEYLKRLTEGKLKNGA